MNQTTMNETIIELSNVSRSFVSGGEDVLILKGINLQIHKGEMVAIVGQSGSGKSTLMNIMGCLDKATGGTYKINGMDTAKMTPDELAKLRREHFGFIFQRYHLLPDLDAIANVEIPSIYAGMEEAQRHERAKSLLGSLGLADRTDHKPGQLSGGQQQRVSIARALMNGGEVIFADEPTGALDSKSGIEVLNILKDLNKKGHTIILVTHDMSIAQNANRIIEIKDGEIIRDTIKETVHTESQKEIKIKKGFSFWDRINQSFKMAIRSILSHRLRSFLTMLGIIIGIASVVSVMAIGNGSQKEILKSIESFGTNTIHVFRGNPNNRASHRFSKLDDSDIRVLKTLPFVQSISPTVSTSRNARFQSLEIPSSIRGVNAEYFNVDGVKFKEGTGFSNDDINTLAGYAVIDEQAEKQFFLKRHVQVIGQVLLIGNVPVKVIGVAKDKEVGQVDNTPIIYMPYTTVTKRIIGKDRISHIALRIRDGVDTKIAEKIVKQILLKKHGKEDFEILNADTIRETVEQVTGVLKLFISSIAIIALIVGGIGVMNIMLVSVTERTQEIGVRMAVGARQSDIRQQFLIEAILICFVGGVIGILLALCVGPVLSLFTKEIKVIYSIGSMVMAFICSSAIGLIFGYLPAKNASELDPVVALTRE